MASRFPRGMDEATRLTRAGRLAEATSLIQRLLRGRDAPDGDEPGPGPAAGSPTTIDGEFVTLDPAEPPPGPRAAQSNARPESRPGVKSDGWPATRPRTGLGATLRDLAARVRPAGLDFGAGGAARPAPDPLPEGASFLAASYSNAAGMRAYKLYVPESRSRHPLPLVVMLHGCTQSPDDFAAGTRMNLLAEEHGFLVAYPAQAVSANAKKCWNWFNPGDQRRHEGEPSLIAGITRQIMGSYPVDPERVYIAGLSAGGALAAVMGAAYPDLYAAVGVHSGLPAGAARDVASAFAAMRQGSAGSGPVRAIVPTIVFHGDRDSTVHPRNGDAIVARVTDSVTGLRTTVQRGPEPQGGGEGGGEGDGAVNGAGHGPGHGGGHGGGHGYSRTIHLDPAGRALCEHWVIHGGGHAWAGGSPSGTYTDPRGPDATREMLRFFLQHRRDPNRPH